MILGVVFITYNTKIAFLYGIRMHCSEDRIHFIVTQVKIIILGSTCFLDCIMSLETEGHSGGSLFPLY